MRLLGTFLLPLFGILASAPAYPAGPPTKTIQNLNMTLNSEANASHRYELFARRADEERNPQVARLFRAASKAESVHRDNQRSAILALGGKPIEPKIEKVEVGTTRQNLEGPIRGEAQEQAELYPRLIRQAEKDGAQVAVKAFMEARDTEAEHEQLFRQALADLGHNPDLDYYVSRATGDTVAVPAGKPFAKAESGQYLKIS